MNFWNYQGAPFSGPMKGRVSLKEPMKAPVLGLSSLEKPFELFTYERQAVALGVLPQHLGGYKQAAAYFSKEMDPVAQQ